MRIYCRCCNQRGEVAGRHERKFLPNCKNGTYVDGGTTNPYAGGKSLSLILLWNEKENKFEPLIEEKKPAVRKKKVA